MSLKRSINRIFGIKRKQEEERIRLIQEKMKSERAEKEKQLKFLISFCNKINQNPAEVNYNELTFLLVDDFQAILNMHYEVIIGLGAKCIPVESAEKALKMVEESEVGTYDVVLTDINMLPMNGLDFSKKLRMLDRPDVKQMVVLAATVDYPSHVYESGMNGYMEKPLDTKLLHTMLERYLRS